MLVLYHNRHNFPEFLNILYIHPRTLRYHLGTLAFGSLIIAIIRMIRIMIEYVESKLKEYHQDNPLVKVKVNISLKLFFY